MAIHPQSGFVEVEATEDEVADFVRQYGREPRSPRATCLTCGERIWYGRANGTHRSLHGLVREQQVRTLRTERPRPVDSDTEEPLDAFRGQVRELQRQRLLLRERINEVGLEALRAGMSYDELADLMGITRPTLRNWFGSKSKDFTDGTGCRI